MLHIRRKAGFALAGALLALLCSTALVFASGVWTVISSPNQGTKNNQLLGVAPVAASDIWAVGYYNAGPYTMSLRTLGEHWDGSNWTIVSTPNAATGNSDYNSLQGVSTISTSNVWAVGYSGNINAAADQTLIMKWNGTNWTIVSSPDPYTTQDLYGVAAGSSTNIWAVGQYTNYNPSSSGGLIEHWNGTAWSSVSNPATQGLYGVIVLASNNVWAVGGSQILHWDGTSWSVVSSPQPPNGDYYQLRSVAAVSSNNIWAVGYEEVASGDGYVYDPLIEHWNGSSWQLGSGVNPNPGTTSLYGVTTLSSTAVWAVGVTGGLSFVEKWDGNQWARMSSPNVGTSNNTFQATAAVPTTGDVWAVGEYYEAASPYQSQTLVEQCQAC